MLTAFVTTHREGTAIGNDIRRRYFRDDRLLRNAYASDAAQRFSALEMAFRTQGQVQGFDWLMLAAQGFQESQLDQSRRSRRGAVGVIRRRCAARTQMFWTSGRERTISRRGKA